MASYMVKSDPGQLTIAANDIWLTGENCSSHHLLRKVNSYSEHSNVHKENDNFMKINWINHQSSVKQWLKLIRICRKDITLVS